MLDDKTNAAVQTGASRATFCRRMPITVLLVEDDDAVREVMRAMLESQGYAVVDADTASEARDLFDRDPAAIDVLITDVKMPRMSGQTLAEHLIAANPNLPVVFISGHPDAIDASDLRGPGRRVVAKPFESAELLGAVNELVAGQLPDQTRPVS
jgi:CheY-like chemotaxis protein